MIARKVGSAGILLLLMSLLLTACAYSTHTGAATPRRVEEATYLTLGGIEQWVTIRGADARKPVLLVVHGGPGDILSPYREEFAPYESEFVVVHWDQRGAGRTYGRNGAQTPEITLDRIVKDGLELAETLRTRFGRKVILLGHSWGSVVGVEMVRRRPELFAAYVGTGQVAGWVAGAHAQYEFLQRSAAAPDAEGLRAALDQMGTFDAGDAGDLRILNREIRRHLGPADTAWLGGLLERARQVSTPQEFADADAGMTLSGRALLADMRAEDLFATAPRLAIAVTVIQGKQDLFTPTEAAEAWFTTLEAPRKQLVLLEDAGHFALLTHGPQMVAALKAAAVAQNPAP